MKTVFDHRSRQDACVLLLPDMPNLDGEPRAAIAYPDRHPRLFRNLTAALQALRYAHEVGE